MGVVSKNEKLKKEKLRPDEALSFDDVLLVPALSEVLPSQVSLETSLGPLKLKIPLLSAAMDTVTESRMAIALALEGGLGVLHKNLSIEEQAAQVKKVKKYQHAKILGPEVVAPSMTLKELRVVISETGVTGFPVVDAAGKLLGVITGRDIRFCEDDQALVSDLMTRTVFTLPEGATRADAVNFFRQHRVEKAPLVDQHGRLRGLMTSKDTRQMVDHPLAVRDRDGALVVAAAVGVGEAEAQRAAQLVEAGVDVLVVDSAHGHSRGVLKALESLAKSYPQVLLVGGNIATPEAGVALVNAGAQVVKIGMGPGSICTTRIVSGAGMPQLSAILDVAEVLRSKHPGVGIIADGGIRYSGDVVKALAAGAHAVMVGSMLAGTDESPGESILYMGRSYKSYRGMGSLGAMKKSFAQDRYFQKGVKELSKMVPEGVEGRVPYKGVLKDLVYQLMGGLRSGMGYLGADTLVALYETGVFRRITHVGLRESHVHGVSVTAETPNYSGGAE